MNQLGYQVKEVNMPSLRISAVYFICAALIACQPAQVKTTFTPFDPYAYGHFRGHSGIRLVGKSSWWRIHRAYLNPLKITGDNGETQFYLVFDYWQSGGWIDIDKGESLILTIDGQHVGFSSRSGGAPFRNWDYPNLSTERALYPVTIETLIQISNADRIEVKILGSKGKFSLEYKIPEAGITEFSKFVDIHLNNLSNSSATE